MLAQALPCPCCEVPRTLRSHTAQQPQHPAPTTLHSQIPSWMHLLPEHPFRELASMGMAPAGLLEFMGMPCSPCSVWN